MTDPVSDAARFDALEARIAHQDSVIEELNGVLTAQWTRIDALLRRVAQLEDRLGEAEAQAGAAAPAPPPPHY